MSAIPRRGLVRVSVLVSDLDDALAWFVDVLGAEVVEDAQVGGKRWLVVRPGPAGAEIVLALPRDEAQRSALGNQAGGRVWLFLATDDFERDRARMATAGVVFREAPRREPYGIVAVFEDPWGNPWDLIGPVEDR